MAVRAVITIVSPLASVTLDPLARNPVALDGAGAGEVLVRVVAFQRAPAHTAGANDAAQRHTGKPLADGVGATDDLNGALGADDDQTWSFTKALSPVAEVSDTHRVDATKALTDGAGTLDAARLAAGKALAHAARAQDAATRTAQYLRELPQVYALDYFAEDYTATDKARVLDVYAAAVAKPRADALTAGDSLGLQAAKVLSLGGRAADAAIMTAGKTLGTPYADGYFSQDYTADTEGLFVGDLLGARALTKARTNTASATDSGFMAMPTTYAADYFAADYCGLQHAW